LFKLQLMPIMSKTIDSVAPNISSAQVTFS
jgi:hypothetical protein